MQETRIPHDHILATTVKGTDVYDPAGQRLGHIDDIVLRKSDGRAAYAIMSFGGFLGLGEQYHPLPWESLTYDTGREGYVVNVSRDQLADAPSYRPGEEPNWNDPTYVERIQTHYGYPVM